MKYLLLLLITFNVYAEIKVSVSKDSKIKNQATFESQIEADVWINDNEQILKGKKYRNSFGLVERWLKTDFGNSIESREIIVAANETQEQYSYFEYKYPQDYSISFSDVTVEENAKKAKKSVRDSLRARLESGENLSLKELNELLR